MLGVGRQARLKSPSFFVRNKRQPCPRAEEERSAQSPAHETRNDAF